MFVPFGSPSWTDCLMRMRKLARKTSAGGGRGADDDGRSTMTSFLIGAIEMGKSSISRLCMAYIWHMYGILFCRQKPVT